ncbi:MAG: sugar 3,4-ketoisomerase [Caulobacterales bacterium]
MGSSIGAGPGAKLAGAPDMLDTPQPLFFAGRARLIACPVITDARGSLTALPFEDMPFVPCRVFAVSGAAVGTRRGGHAHRSGEQFLVCLAGRIEVLLRLEGKAERVTLEAGGPGLLIGPGVWSRQTYLEAGAVLLALASEPYDPTSYVDDSSE